MERLPKAYLEVVDFFARGPGAAAILAFRPSPESQERIRYLLSRNAADELTQPKPTSWTVWVRSNIQCSW